MCYIKNRDCGVHLEGLFATMNEESDSLEFSRPAYEAIWTPKKGIVSLIESSYR